MIDRGAYEEFRIIFNFHASMLRISSDLVLTDADEYRSLFAQIW